MSKYDKETKFYWLQLKEDFFESDAIEWLEEQEPNGRDYAYFYLKLCLKSLKTNGILIRNVGNILIPYDYKKLAELTKMDFDTVCVAMELLQKIGLVEVLENGEIYITQLENLIGSVSKGALKKQQQRQLRRQKEDKCPPKLDIKLKDKDKNKIKSKTTTMYEYIENNFGRTISSIEVEKIDQWLSLYKEDVIKYAIEISILNNKKTFNYINGILRNWKTAGYKTLQEIKNNEKKEIKKMTEEEQKEFDEIFDYDWLNDE